MTEMNENQLNERI